MKAAACPRVACRPRWRVLPLSVFRPTPQLARSTCPSGGAAEAGNIIRDRDPNPDESVFCGKRERGVLVHILGLLAYLVVQLGQ